jgi:hypothetical protein
MIDKNKEYKTRDGKKVRIYATDAGGLYPIHGAILSKEKDFWYKHSWDKNGKYVTEVEEGRNDLIEVKKTETIYIHVLKLWRKNEKENPWFKVCKRSVTLTIQELREQLALQGESELLEVIERTYEV